LVKLTVLGCGGGIGSGAHTTCFLLDEDVLIDAGTGITALSLEQLARIDRVFLTHSHLDHVLGLPLLVDAVGDRRGKPLIVHALPETLEILADHLFNWKLWPDFREIPDASQPWLRFEPLPLGSAVKLGSRTISSLPAHHTVPACGYRISEAGRSLVFTGDTTRSEALMHALNEMNDLDHLIIETSFENNLRDIAVASMHHWPDSLAQELGHLKANPRIWITHLKPGNQEAIMDELRRRIAGRDIAPLVQGQVIEW
jgi:ribonuclease BN (tRNA processing enzyme)